MSKKKKYSPCTVYYTSKTPDGECPVGLDLVAEPVDGNLYIADGRVKSFHGSVNIICKKTGVVSTDRATLKSAEGFGNNIERAYTALNHWRKLGYRGSPASMASFTREKFRHKKNKGEIVSRCNASANNILRPYFTGGWIETPEESKGSVHAKVYHYDINKAYLSAAGGGLPSRLDPFNGDPAALGYVALMRIKGDVSHLPNFLQPFLNDDLTLVTSEDVKAYNLKGTIVKGVQYYDLDVDLLPVISELEPALPYDLWKKCTQTFWGMFCSSSGLDIVDYETKTERKLWNRNQNIAWASIIVRRVAKMVYDAWVNYDGISCFVDSVFTLSPLPESLVGEGVGKWKLEGEYDKGIYLAGSGVWHPLPFNSRRHFLDKSLWKKHSGFQAK